MMKEALIVKKQVAVLVATYDRSSKGHRAAIFLTGQRMSGNGHSSVESLMNARTEVSQILQKLDGLRTELADSRV